MPTPIEQVSLQFLLGTNLHYKYDSWYIILPICTDANNCNMNKVFQNNSINIWLTIYFTKFITTFLLQIYFMLACKEMEIFEFSIFPIFYQSCENCFLEGIASLLTVSKNSVFFCPRKSREKKNYLFKNVGRILTKY